MILTVIMVFTSFNGTYKLLRPTVKLPKLKISLSEKNEL